MSELIVLPNIVDGFSYNTQLWSFADRFYLSALAQMDILRRAANYRARWFVVPDDQSDEAVETTPNAQSVAPYDTFYYQISVAPGAYLWGYRFSSISAIDANNNPVATVASDLLVQVVDSCTGIPLFQDFSNAGGLAINFAQVRMLPILLTQPRLVLEPGNVTVQIANRTGNTITCQLLLHFAEPCRTITEEDREREFALLAQARAA